MSEIIKTIVFAAVGSILVLGAVLVNSASRPKENDQFGLIGEEFYPEFQSPDEATFLEISAYDFDKGKVRKFRVEYKDGLWRIPSHHDYPAESPQRLFSTAASVIGIEREALAGRGKEAHERFGVVDPTSNEAEGSDEDKAAGIRITLGKGDDDVLADYIVGKEVESGDEDDAMLREIRGEDEKKPLFYVRRPDEPETYIASVSIDASTKFTDWIEPDLLLLDASDLRELVVNDYSFETKVEEVEILPGVFQQVGRSEKVDGESYTLTKDSNFGSWKLKGLDEETEELETSKITDITSGLDDFKILGVRPRVKIDGKPILTQDLKLEFPESIRSQQAAQLAIQEVALDLESRGFNVGQNPSDKSLTISSDQGELTAATNEGVVYRLYFGKVFTGTDEEIEIGGAAEESDDSKETKDADAKPEDEAKDGEKPENETGDDNSAEEKGEEDKDSDKKESRYLLVRVEFDPKFIEDKPVPPVEPKEPEKPATTKEDTGEETPEKPKPPAPPEEKPAPPTPTEEKPTPPAPPEEKPEPSADKPEASDPGKGQPDAKQESDPANSSDDSECAPEDDATTESVGAAAPEPTTGDEPKDAEDKESADTPKADEKPANPQDDKKPETQENKDAEDKDTPDTKDKKDDEPKVEEKEDPEAEYQKAMDEYRSAQIQYEADKKKYEDDLKKYEEKIEKGKEKVDALNQRFADWYYVISAESLKNLRLSRSDLVRKKEKPEEDKTDEGEPKDDAAATNQAAADKFLAENKAQEGVMTTESGLQYKVLKAGEGESPKATNRVKVKYKGTLIDGTVFDESGDETIEFGVGDVIKGWTEALQLMKPGAKWQLFIPPALAYGERGSGAKIGPNSLLIFEVELVSFE